MLNPNVVSLTFNLPYNNMDFKGLNKFISCQIQQRTIQILHQQTYEVMKYKYGYNYLFPICNPIVASSSKCVPPIGRHHDANIHSSKG